MASKNKLPGQLLAVDVDYIAKRNEHFMAQPKAKRASIIAQDVLAQLDAETIRAQPGAYLGVKRTEVSAATSLQILLEQEAVTCSACAIGSAFVSCVRYTNELDVPEQPVDYTGQVYSIPVDTGSNFDKMMRRLELAFTQQELYAMEHCFEQDSVGHLAADAESAVEDSAVYQRCAETDYPTERLRIIMRHIIKSSGRFTIKGLKLAPNNPDKE